MARIYEKDKACAAPRCTSTMTGHDLPRFCAEHNDLNKLEAPRFPIEDALKPECDQLRADLLAIEHRTRHLHDKAYSAAEKEGRQNSIGEVYANITLAVRHIEDARWRIGKVLQYARDGVSCFDAAPGVTP